MSDFTAKNYFVHAGRRLLGGEIPEKLWFSPPRYAEVMPDEPFLNAFYAKIVRTT